MAENIKNNEAGGNIPRHIAIILDGNGRWAKNRGLPRKAGHVAGSENFRKIATYCQEIGVEYAFVEQDKTYGDETPLQCAEISYQNMKKKGWMEE